MARDERRFTRTQILPRLTEPQWQAVIASVAFFEAEFEDERPEEVKRLNEAFDRLQQLRKVRKI